MATTTSTATTASCRSSSSSTSRGVSRAPSRSVCNRDVRSTLMHRRLRPLVLAAALNLTAGTAIAAAQTVMIRNAPPNTAAEVILNGAPVGAGTTNEAGEVTIPLMTGTTVGDKGIDANLFVDVCDKMRRVQIVDRAKIVPAPADTCDRREISGIFWVRT